MEAIRRLNAASADDLKQFSEVLSEWDILEAVNTAHLVKGRVEIIRKFDQMIQNRVPEKPDMQNYIKDHPWLIDPKWTMLVHEQALDRLVVEKFRIKPVGGEGRRRLDFFCLGDRYKTAHIVEAKRPGDLVGRKELDQLRDYVLFLQQRLVEEATNADDRRTVVKGLLIADRIRPGDEGHAKAGQNAGLFDIRTWPNLLTTAEAMHKEFLDVVKMRAPAGDPRMEDLVVSDGPASRRRRRREAPKRKKSARKKSKVRRA